MSKIREGCYNVRVVVGKNGKPRVGFVYKLYGGSKRHYEWKDAPESTRKAMQTAITIGTPE